MITINEHIANFSYYIKQIIFSIIICSVLTSLIFLPILFIFFNLFYAVFTKPVSLTDGNYGLLKNSNDKPLVVELWDSNCKQTCQNIESSLDSLIKKDFSGKIILADVNCQENSNLCSSLTVKKSYPQIIWVDSDTKQKFSFDDEFSDQNIKKFIQTQLSFPFVFLKDKDKLSNIKNDQKDGTTFTFYYKGKYENEEKYKNAQKAAKKIIQNSKCKFFAIEDKKNKFSAIREKDSESFYHGDWSQDSLFLFMKQRLFPTLIELNKKTINQLKSSQRLSLVAFLDPEIYLSDWKHLAQEVESDFQFSYVIYSPSNYFVRLVGINSANLPKVILFDANNLKWILYENDLTDTGLTKWIKQLDLNDAIWTKPKFAFFSNLITSGGPLFYLFLLFLICIIAIMIKVINDSIGKRPRNKKRSDHAYEAL